MEAAPYINNHYFMDFKQFPGSSHALCGATISESLRSHNAENLTDISAFYCCQYALNLINYGIKTYFVSEHRTWLAKSPPFADCTACDLFHGGVNSADSVLAYLRRNSAECERVGLMLTDEILNSYLSYFFTYIEYLRSQNVFRRHRLTAASLSDALGNDNKCLEFSLAWTPDNFDLTDELSRFKLWERPAQKVEEPSTQRVIQNTPLTSHDVQQNIAITCPQCGGSISSINDECCPSCQTELFSRSCPACGTDNHGRYHCFSCGTSLGSITDVTPETRFIEDSETQVISSMLEQMRENMPKMPDSKINTSRSWHRKRASWHKKLTFAEKLSFYQDMSKSYPESAFNPNSFFEVFNGLSLQEGYFLDYRYEEVDFDFGGSPDLFARKIGSVPLQLAHNGESVEKHDVFDVLKYEKTLSGLWQLVVFSVVYNRFYLFWHSNYDDYQPVFCREHYERLLDRFSEYLKPDSLELLRRQDIRPRVVSDDYLNGQVVMMLFNRFSGFCWTRYTIKNGRIVKFEDEEIARINRTLRF